MDSRIVCAFLTTPYEVKCVIQSCEVHLYCQQGRVLRNEATAEEGTVLKDRHRGGARRCRVKVECTVVKKECTFHHRRTSIYFPRENFIKYLLF